MTGPCFLFAFTDWLGTVMSTGENSEVCKSLRGDLITPLPLRSTCVWHGLQERRFAAAAAAAPIITHQLSFLVGSYLCYSLSHQLTGLQWWCKFSRFASATWESSSLRKRQHYSAFFFLTVAGVLLNWPKAFPWIKHTLKEGLNQSKRSKLGTDFVLAVALSNSACTEKRIWKMKEETMTSF